MLNKRDIINFLYVISFPVYGLGAYISAAVSPSIGYICSISIHILIILFYLIDLAYKRVVRIKVNGLYFLTMALQLTCVVSLFVSLSNNLPSMNMIDVVTKSILLVLPFQSFIVVFLYNEKQKNSFVNMTFLSWSILLLMNVIGFFGFGIGNETNGIPGRITFPFLDSFYSAACLVAMLNLMILAFIKKSLKDPLKLTYLISYFALNLALLYYIDSRLSLLIFFGVFLLFALNLSRRFRGVFLASIFTLPLLLNFGVLVYRILSLPVFVAIVRRVDLIDATTFNGKSLLWQRTLDWLMFDQRGVLFGNGAEGHYFLHLIPDLAKKWFPREESLHLHSTVLMTLVDQGIFGFVLLLVACYRMYLYYRTEFQKSSTDATFFAVVVFVIFAMQVDTFAYLGTLGYTILGLLIARASVDLKTV
jgi:hypothetical protein